MRLSRDDKDVEKLRKYIQSFGNPFKPLGKHLINLSTGVVASGEITEKAFSLHDQKVKNLWKKLSAPVFLM